MGAAPSRLDYLLAAVIAASVSTAPIFVLLSGVPGPAAATWRLAISTAILAAYGAASGSLSRPGARDLALMALAGALLAAHFDAWMTSLYLIPAGVSTAIVDSYPAVLVVVGRLAMGERYGPAKVAGAALAVAAAALLSVDPGPRHLEGAALALAGMASMAGYVSLGRLLRRRVSLATYATTVYSVAALVSLLVSLASGCPLYGYPPTSWAYLVALAVVPMIGGHTVMNYLLGRRDLLASATPVVAEPAGASVLAALVLGQRLGAFEAALVGLAVAGVAAAVAAQ